MTTTEMDTHLLTGLEILLAEDNPTNQMVASQMLEALGATVTLTMDGVETLEVLQTRDFDVLLIDIEMPRLSGLEVIRKLRGGGAAPGRGTVIALTAFVMPEHRAAILEAGAEGIIAKPVVSIDDFGREIRRLHNAHPGSEQAKAPASDVPAAARQTIETSQLQMLEDAVGIEALREILDRALEDLSSLAQRMEALPSSRDLEETRELTHILVSVAGTVGAARLSSVAQEMNDAAHAEDWPRITAELVEAQSLATMALSELGTYRAAL